MNTYINQIFIVDDSGGYLFDVELVLEVGQSFRHWGKIYMVDSVEEIEKNLFYTTTHEIK